MRLLNNFINGLVFLIAVGFCQLVFSNTHTEMWSQAIITGSISKDKKIKYYIQPELSFEDDEYKYRSSNLYLGAGYQISPTIIVWLMNGLHDNRHPNGSYENINSIRQEVDWNIIPSGPHTLMSIARLEQRKNFIEPQWYVRAREKLTLRIPLSSWQNHSFVTFEEVILNFNNPAWINCNSVFNQNRAFIGIGTTLSKYVEFDLGYLNQYSLRTGGNQVNNVLYLLFNVALD
jgi:hypothetical protein